MITLVNLLHKSAVWFVLVSVVIISYLFGTVLGTSVAAAQGKGGYNVNFGDFQSMLNGLRAFVGIASIVVPAVILCIETYRLRSGGRAGNDIIMLAIAWCALAYVIR